MVSYLKIPAMTPPEVLHYLRDTGRAWTGKGVFVELGCWLGATGAATLAGLSKAGYDKPFYCYDRWSANESEVRKAREQGVSIVEKQNLLPLFLDNVGYDNTKAYRGSIERTVRSYPGDPIEICLLDAPKRNPIFNNVMRTLRPHLIPGVTVLGLLDYYFYRSVGRTRKARFMAPVHYMRKNRKHFTILAEWPGLTSCVFFKVESIPKNV